MLSPLPEHPAVSYVMPVLNEAKHLGEAVRAVLSQEYAGEQELVLALGASTDGTDEVADALAASDPRVRLVRNPRNDIPIGLNLAIAASRHPVIVRVDAHAELPPGYTAAAVEILHRTGAADVGGMMVAKGHGRFQRAVARAYNSPFGLGGGSWHHGEEEIESDSAYLGVFRREVLEAVGGYDETLRRAEDWELSHRIRAAGHLIIFTPKLKVVYWPRSSWDALRRQMYATGVWRGHLVRRQGSTPWRYLPPPAVAVLVAISLLVGLLQLFGVARGAGWALAHVPSLGYLVGVSAVGISRLGGDNLADRLLNVVVLATMHLSWGSGFIKGWLTGAATTVDRSRLG
ncbi:glycosyltransferase family 2 protein [Propionicimonas paludicola]|uniref:glycosyltransferase family 2 protein n=1 Tax=Propionicimonas paludicola TaxID=185243 RepID=UPI002481A8B7|nr:glycosyltransferase family 2 protein [Propionicimonas paludicola]